MSPRYYLSLLFLCTGFMFSPCAYAVEDDLTKQLEELEKLIEQEPVTPIDEQSFDLDSFSGLLELDFLPEPLASLFKGLTIKDFSWDTEEKDGIETTIIKGTVNFAGADVFAELRTRTPSEGKKIAQPHKTESKIPFIEQLRVQLKKEELSKPVKDASYTTAFKIGLPSGWKLSDSFKDLASYDPLTISKAWIIISNGTYQDEELNIGVQPGINVLAQIKFNDLKVEQSIVNKLRQVMGKIVDSVILYGHLNPAKIADSRIKVCIPVPAEKKISFYDLLPLETITMPTVVKSALRNTALIKPIFELELVKGVQIKKVELESGISFMKNDIITRFLFVTLKNNKPGVSASLILSPQWKFSELSADLAALDKIQLIDPMLIVSNFDYDDVDRAIAVETGLNFYSGLILTDALKDLEVFVQKLASQYVVMENLALHLHGVIAPDMKKSQLAIEIPVEIGVDFEKMWKQGLIKSEPYIQRITSSSFKAIVSATATIDISAGIFVKPRTQLKPIEFRGGVKVLPNKIGIYGSISEFDPVFGLNWLGFGPFGIEMGWDFAISSAIAAAIGVPLPTDVGLRGELRIGKVPMRTTGRGALKIELSENDLGNFLMHVEIDKIPISYLLSLLADMVKKPAITAHLPEINFVDLKGYCCLQETTIASTRYKPGFDLMAGVAIGNFLGHGEVRISEEGKNLYIEASMDPVDLDYFKLSTAEFDKNKENIGAKLLIDIGVDRPLKAQIIYINGQVEIPALGLTSKTNFDLKEGKLTADFLGVIFNHFQGESHLELPSEDITNFVFSAGFKNDFYDYVKEQLPQALDALQETTAENLEQFKEGIGEFKTKFHGNVQDEIDRVDALIKKTDQKIEQLETECSQAEGLKKATICTRNLAMAFELGTQKKGLEIYKNGLLKGGRTVVETATAGTKQVIALSETVAQKTLEAASAIASGAFIVGDILSIKGASVKITGKELKEGKLPQVTIKATIKLPNQSEATEITFDLQFDIKNPATFFVDFGQQFMGAIASSIEENTHYVINATPYDFSAVLVGDTTEYPIPAHKKSEIAVEKFVMHGIKLSLKAPEKRAYEILQEEADLGPQGVTYTILCEPTLTKKPNAITGTIAKAKFFLHRKPRPFYPGGLVNESESITFAIR